jgi:hypothetical protein
MDENALRLIASLCGATGALMLLAPRSVERIEELLNRDWGHQRVFAIRAGLPGERRLEERLNSPVLTRSLVWDDALRRHPRATGAGLCCVALLLAILA